MTWVLAGPEKPDEAAEAPPQFSPDGRYWLEGKRWVPVYDVFAPGPTVEEREGHRARNVLLAVLAVVVIAVLVLAGAAYGGALRGIGIPRPGGPSTAKQPASPAAVSASLTGVFDNAGISNDPKPASADLDGNGFSYSATALKDEKAGPGSTVGVGGVSFRWPDTTAGAADNVVAQGQTIPVQAGSGAAQIGFLGAATGTASGGEATLTYSDGTTTHFELGFSEWTLDQGKSSPAYGNVEAIKMDYRNSAFALDQLISTYVFYAGLPLERSKSLVSVTLPVTAAPQLLHIFAVSTSTTPIAGPVVDAITPASAVADQQVTIIGTGFGATQGSGYVTLTDAAMVWGVPGMEPTLQIKSWSDTRITFLVPDRSGSGGIWHIWPGTLATVGVAAGGRISHDMGLLEMSQH
ncbi:MAG TPA: IPT/TIG domain-containing protein [Candidatus Dormibacteraeota bacterium]|nr:IPT/TIG domain-containing protein [Candidatus Dormibacteraeota bacterium]